MSLRGEPTSIADPALFALALFRARLGRRTALSHGATLITARACEQHDRSLVTTQYGRYPHTDERALVHQVFHGLRSCAIENFNEQFKGIFDAHGEVPTKELANTQRFARGAIFLFQIVLLYHFQQGLDLRRDLKAFIKTA